jgi:MYXO-CTERM domain-containing protein
MRDSRRVSWRVLAGYLRPQRRQALVMAMLLLGSVGLQLAYPQILRDFIDQAAAGAPRQTLLGMALLFVGWHWRRRRPRCRPRG